MIFRHDRQTGAVKPAFRLVPQKVEIKSSQLTSAAPVSGTSPVSVTPESGITIGPLPGNIQRPPEHRRGPAPLLLQSLSPEQMKREETAGVHTPR